MIVSHFADFPSHFIFFFYLTPEVKLCLDDLKEKKDQSQLTAGANAAFSGYL